MSKCWGNIDSLKKTHPPIFASVIAAKNINTDWVTLLYQKWEGGGIAGTFNVVRGGNGESK